MSQSATLVSKTARMPDSRSQWSRWEREVEFPGSPTMRMPSRSAGAMDGFAARGCSALTARTQGSSTTGRCSMPRTGSPIVIQARSTRPAATAPQQPRLEFSVSNSRLTCGNRRRKSTTASDMK